MLHFSQPILPKFLVNNGTMHCSTVLFNLFSTADCYSCSKLYLQNLIHLILIFRNFYLLALIWMILSLLSSTKLVCKYSMEFECHFLYHILCMHLDFFCHGISTNIWYWQPKGSSQETSTPKPLLSSTKYTTPHANYYFHTQSYKKTALWIS